MAMSLVALDYSRPVQALFRRVSRAGTIYSTGQRAINIALDDTLVGVLSGELPRMPNGLRLAPHWMSEMVSRVSPGMPVWIGDGRLYVPGCGWSLRLPEHPAWEPRPDLSAQRWCRKSVVRQVRLLALHLADVSRQEGLASLVGPLLLGRPRGDTALARMALPALRLLARVGWMRDRAGVEGAASRLAGLGPGLTPSGDDALGGFAAVMALLSPYLSRDAAPRTSIAVAIATAARPRTNRLSAVLLTHAARGEVAEHVGAVITALASPGSPREASEAALHAADRLLAFGGTSGGDTLLGLLLGLRALEGPFDQGAHEDDCTGADQA